MARRRSKRRIDLMPIAPLIVVAIAGVTYVHCRRWLGDPTEAIFPTAAVVLLCILAVRPWRYS